MGKRERTSCLGSFLLLMSPDYCVALPRDTVGLSAVCACGISGSCSLFLTTESIAFLLIFRFLCSYFGGHFIGENFKTYFFSCCVWFNIEQH